MSNISFALITLDWTSILTGVLSSLAASSFFILILFRIRPHVRISPVIAKDVNPDTGDTVFVFKVINRSPFFKIYDLKCSLRIHINKSSHNNGEDRKRTDDNDKLTLINDNFWVLSNFNIKHISQRFDKELKVKTRTDYAVQVGTEYDLEKVISENKTIELQVSAKHPLSGFTKVTIEDYKHKTKIVSGSFGSGNCFDIK